MVKLYLKNKTLVLHFNKMNHHDHSKDSNKKKKNIELYKPLKNLPEKLLIWHRRLKSHFCNCITDIL